MVWKQEVGGFGIQQVDVREETDSVLHIFFQGVIEINWNLKGH